jgi:hypothetical protein
VSPFDTWSGCPKMTINKSLGHPPFQGWWKQHGHHFPTLSRLARHFLAISATSCPVERLLSVVGQVDAVRRTSLSPDTMTLLVFFHETLTLVRKIRASRIVRSTLEGRLEMT